MDIRNSRAAGYPGMDADELARLQRLTGGFPGTDASRPMPPASMSGSPAAAAPPAAGQNIPTGISPSVMMGQMGPPMGQTPAPASGMGPGMAAVPGTAENGMMQPAVNPAAGMLPMEGMFPMSRMYAGAAPSLAAAPMPNTAAVRAAAPSAAAVAGTGTAANPANPAADAATDADMQNFMEQGYLMGPNCFGRDARAYAERLMEYINDEYRDHLTYLALSRRAPSNQARTILRRIARDEMRHARRWAAAYFLITGKRYFPERGTVEAAPITSYSQALRERYLAESQDAVKYRRFARETTDRCLRRLAMETSDDERQHAQHILDLIQQQYR